jgi:acyl homoserine lactone synthase
MELVEGTAQQIGPQLWAELLRYRYRVFVEALGWPLCCKVGQEQDEFDRDDTVYVVASRGDGRVVGSARLLPTTRPYLIAKIGGGLWPDGRLPCADDVWELSRFAAVDVDGTWGDVRARLYSEAAYALLAECLACAGRLGARSLITASPVGVVRLLRHACVQHRTLGAASRINGERLVGLEISCPG